MASKFRPLFTLVARVSCIDCKDEFQTTRRLNEHRTCGASHNLCPMVYQDQMQSVDDQLVGYA